MLGIGLGRLEARSDGGNKIIMDDVSDIRFVSGITKLVYTVLFNLFSPYDIDNNKGSDFINITKNIALLASQPEKILAIITNEVENVENRIKFSQTQFVEEYGIEIPDNERLKSINIINIEPDIINTEILIDLEIINQEGNKCYVTV